MINFAKAKLASLTGLRAEIEPDISKPTFRMIHLIAQRDVLDHVGWRQFLWGFDIFWNDVPVIKLLFLTNIIVWAIMWVSLR